MHRKVPTNLLQANQFYGGSGAKPQKHKNRSKLNSNRHKGTQGRGLPLQTLARLMWVPLVASRWFVLTGFPEKEAI